MTKLVGSHDVHFIDFMFGLLEYDPALRLTPTQSLTHPFLAPLFPLAMLSNHGRPYNQSLYNRVASNNAFQFVFKYSPIPKLENGVVFQEEEETIEIDGNKREFLY
jgi:serine/threonine protein kinase